jgi:hypothetical protein
VPAREPVSLIFVERTLLPPPLPLPFSISIPLASSRRSPPPAAMVNRTSVRYRAHRGGRCGGIGDPVPAAGTDARRRHLRLHLLKHLRRRQPRTGAHLALGRGGFGVCHGVHRSADTGEQHAITGSRASDLDAIEDEPSDARRSRHATGCRDGSPARPPHLRLQPASPNPSPFRFPPSPPLPPPLPPSPTLAALTYTVFPSSTSSLLRACLSALDYIADSDCLHIRPSAPRCHKCIPCKKRFHFAYLPTLRPARCCPITLTSNSIASRNLEGKVKAVIAKPTVLFSKHACLCIALCLEDHPIYVFP